jgi:hypothetical protein
VPGDGWGEGETLKIPIAKTDFSQSDFECFLTGSKYTRPTLFPQWLGRNFPSAQLLLAADVTTAFHAMFFSLNKTF